MQSSPLVSVIIPNYNHAVFLETRIQSVLDQSYSNLEIILLDDCSTDNSRDIIERYRFNAQVSHIVYNQINSGSTFKQWNKGIELAKGNWVWFAESDDSADEDFLMRLTEPLKEDTNIGIVYCQSMSMDSTGKVWGDCLMWTDDLDVQLWRSNFLIEGKDAIRNYLMVKNIIPNASACLISKKAFYLSGKAPIEMKYCGDWYLWCNILLQYNLAYVSTPLNYFRFHTATTRAFQSLDAFERKVEEDCKVIKLITSHIEIYEEKIVQSFNKIEQDIYLYFIENRKFPISLNRFREIFIRYNFNASISLIKLYKTYFNLAWKKIK